MTENACCNEYFVTFAFEKIIKGNELDYVLSKTY